MPGAVDAFVTRMFPRSPYRVGAIAALCTLAATACAPATIGISPGTILSAVIASIPASTTTVSRGGGGTSGGTPTRARIPASPAPSAMAARELNIADSYIGTRYVWGGNSPSEGFDCSGFTKYVFAKLGVSLPRTSRDQVRAGTAVAPDFHSLLPGDLMMFAEPGEAISHVAIYAGNGRIIHSSSTNGGVGYTDLNSGGDWFVAYFVAARRVR
jgi:cell wall-associated NlpC family hydrolase